MSRGYMTALTLAIFGVGLGIGVSVSRGWIPLAIEPAKTGSLGYEVTQQEELPPPNDADLAELKRLKTINIKQNPVDPTIFEKQTEPEANTSVSKEPKRKRSDQTSRIAKTSEFDDDKPEDDGRADRTTTRSRERTVVKQDAQNGSDDPDSKSESSAPQQRITRVAHQDPTESGNDAKSSTKDATNQSPRELFAEAKDKLSAGETLAAHRILSKIYWNHKEYRPQIKDTLDRTANEIFFQPKPDFIAAYVVQDGDRLESIAKKYNLSWQYLGKLNGTNPKRLRADQKLKVLKGPFGAVVDLKEFALTIHLQGYYVKRYDVGIGKDGASPIGKFPVLNKVENPQYTGDDGKVIEGDDPSNPLGERWIDIGNSFGIHGTIDPDSIGRAASRGCIRMLDDDITEVYDFLVKGSDVVIRK